MFSCPLLTWSTCSLLVLTRDQTALLLSRILYIALAPCFSFAAAACIVFDNLYADFILQVKPESTGV